MKTTRALTITTVTLALLAAAAAPAAAQDGAKALFYGASGATISPNAPGAPPGARRPDAPASNLATGFPTTPGAPSAAAPVPAEYMGVSYWVELLRPDGQQSRVTPEQSFRSGDRIKLYVKANRDGHLMLVNLGSTGRTNVLFPSAASGGSSLVQAGTEIAVPATAWIRFDDNPGEETLLLMLSPTAMNAGGFDAARFSAFASAKGAKDLVLETDTSGPMPAGYAVAPASSLQDGGVVTVQIRLRHR